MLTNWKRSLFKNGPPDFFAVAFALLVLPTVLGLLLTLALAPEPQRPDDPLKQAEILVTEGQLIPALRLLRAQAVTHADDIAFHRRLLEIYFRLPEYNGKYRLREDSDVIPMYEKMCGSTDQITADYGCYFLGLTHSHQNRYQQALSLFSRVRNQNQPYLNFSSGTAHMYLGQHDKAQEEFERELALGTDQGITVGALCQSIVVTRNWKKLEALLMNPDTAGLVPFFARQRYRLAHGRMAEYLENYFRGILPAVQIIPCLMAALGLISWVSLIRWWLPDRRLPWVPFGAAILSGGIMGLFMLVVGDVASLIAELRFKGEVINDFLYSVLFIGLIEELAKIMPLLGFAAAGRWIKRPSDWMIYAAGSGLGFGVLEAVFYMAGMGHSIAIGRIFVSLPLHVLLTSSVGIALGETERRRRNRALLFAVAIGVVALIHGVFDFALLGPISALAGLAFYAVLIVAVIFLRGRAGILDLSGFERESSSAAEESYIVLPSLCFASIMLLNVILTGLTLERSAWISTILMRAFFTMGPMYLLFMLSRQPAVSEWIPDWYDPPASAIS